MKLTKTQSKKLIQANSRDIERNHLTIDDVVRIREALEKDQWKSLEEAKIFAFTESNNLADPRDEFETLEQFKATLKSEGVI